MNLIGQRLGSYDILDEIGRGGMAVVYEAGGPDGRAVAIKVPHRERLQTQEDVETYLTEARVLASLDHPNIVPVYDVGQTDEFPCFIVSKFIPIIHAIVNDSFMHQKPVIGTSIRNRFDLFHLLHATKLKISDF